ncbi:MAG: YkvA family protein [Cyclobacteriaceae bacterium]
MAILKNAFFDLALTQAARLAGKPARMVRLLGQLAFKLKSVNWKSVNGPFLKEKFMLLGRLLQAHIKGHYRIQSFRFLLILIAAVIYFLNPLDLIPDFIIGIGLTDDLAVVTWVFQAAAYELDAFMRWEKSTVADSIL